MRQELIGTFLSEVRTFQPSALFSKKPGNRCCKSVKYGGTCDAGIPLVFVIHAKSLICCKSSSLIVWIAFCFLVLDTGDFLRDRIPSARGVSLYTPEIAKDL